MVATLEIMLHIERLPDTALFNNREFLKYAARSTVDWALHKAAKIGTIIRIAYGVYRKASPFVADEPSIQRVAE